MAFFNRWRFIFLTAFVVLFVDILSKSLTNAFLPHMGHVLPIYPYGGIPVFKNFLGIEFSINHLTNRGAAWGMLGGYQDWLLIVRIFLIVGMVFYLFYINKVPSIRFPLALVIIGAIGNVIDYFVYGHVVDMFHFVLWGFDFAIFNVADSAVTVGICWLVASSCYQELRKWKHREG